VGLKRIISAPEEDRNHLKPITPYYGAKQKNLSDFYPIEQRNTQTTNQLIRLDFLQ
jgi:hypothetical protein